MQKPVLKYPGSKWRIAAWVLEHMPPHKVYVEACFGTGAVFFSKAPSDIEIINDIDGDIVNLFKACRDYPGELAKLIEYTPLSREEYIDCCSRRKTEGLCLAQAARSLERARQTLVSFWQAYKISDSKTWQCAQNTGATGYIRDWSELPERIVQVARRLKHAQIENCDCIELIRRCDDEQTFIYIDPPYLQSTYYTKKCYANEMTEAQHITLLETVKASSAKILISGYESELYNDTLSGWGTDAKSNTNRNGAARIEKLYYNYKNQTLFDLH